MKKYSSYHIIFSYSENKSPPIRKIINFSLFFKALQFLALYLFFELTYVPLKAKRLESSKNEWGKK